MLTDLDPEFFKIIEEGRLRLIMPSHSAASTNSIWNHQNKWCRSRVETLDGQTVSQGFSKFMNLGQDNTDIGFTANDILDAIREGKEVVATLKQDGSCLIRSVHNGKVFFRTRGSLKYTYHEEAEKEMSQFLEMYPKLNDPTWETTRSLLFEWVTPAFQIVIPYEKPDLFLLGAVDHGHRHYSHLRYLTMQELEPISKECGVSLVEYHTINSVADWYAFYHEVLEHREIEGYVLRMNDQQDLVKIKSKPYINKHSIKSELSFKKMVDFWLLNGKDSVYESILGQIEKMYDEEVLMWALPFVDNLFVAVEAWEKAYTKVMLDVESRRHLSRKDFAIEMQQVYTGDDGIFFPMAMQMWQGKPVDDKTVRNYMLRFDQGIKGQFS